MWNKNTLWRQFSMISVETLQNYNPSLVRSLNEDVTYLCVISHDRDIINDNIVLEPSVEFIEAKQVEKFSPEFSYGKNSSLLHLECRFNGDPVILELKASPKTVISKHNLIPAMQPDRSFFFDEPSKAVFRNWLSLRYRRQTLPDLLVSQTLPLWGYLKQEGKKDTEGIIGYWIDYDPRSEPQQDIPYALSLYIVYSATHAGAQEQAEHLASEIRERFPQWGIDEGGFIELNDCMACAEDCFTLADLQNCIYFDIEQVNFYLQESAKKGTDAEI